MMSNSEWLEYCKSLIPEMNKRFFSFMGRYPNLKNPIRFTDKLEWLKIYDSTELKTYCSDKITVRDYVKNKIGKDISIPILDIYNNFDDIDFSILPKDYVIKTNHGSHTNIIVKNGNINKEIANKKFNEWLNKDWSWWGYEMFYKNIKPKILIEKYMNDGYDDLIDYKFLCFNGKPLFCQVISDRNNLKKHLNYYDMNWCQCTEMSRVDFPANYQIKHNMPYTYNEMKEYASVLSRDFKFVRVDFYEIENKVYFGELTFIPGAAYIKYKKDQTDFILGKLLQL